MYAEYAYYTEERGKIHMLHFDAVFDKNNAHIGYFLRIRLDLITNGLRVIVPEKLKDKPVEFVMIMPELPDDRSVPEFDFPMIKYLYIPSCVKHLRIMSEIYRSGGIAPKNTKDDRFYLLNGCEVEISPDNPEFCNFDHGIYTKDMKKLCRIFSPKECFEVPANVEEICDDAGRGLKGLKRLIIPYGVKTIGESAFEGCEDLEEADISSENIGARAFYGCRRLSSLTIKGAKIIFKDAFEGCRGHGEILKNAFNVCVDLKKFKCVIDESGDFELSVDCEDIIQPKNDNKEHSILGNSPFLENKHLKKLTLSNIKNVCFGAFSSCENLEELIIENAEKIGQFAFISCYSLRNIKAECKELYGSAFNSCKTLENVSLKNTEIIHGGAFSHCEGLKEIVLPDTLREIGDYTFYKTGIERLSIPLSVRRLGKEILSGGTIEVASVNGDFFLTCEEIMHAGYSGATLAVKDAEKGEILYELDLSYDLSEIFSKWGINFDAYRNSDDRFSEYKNALFSARSSLRHIPNPDGGVYEPLRRYVSDLTALEVLEKIESDDREILSEYRFYDDIEIKRFLDLIDYSARKGNAEITAALLMKMNERRSRG